MKVVKASYKINFFELDHPVVVGQHGYWPATETLHNLVLNAATDDAFLVYRTIESIRHIELGAIRGLYPLGL